ncbi:MAG: hypothetical protein OHK0026_10830 [Rhodocyclaceae bacterium]
MNARWVSAEDEGELARFIEADAHRVAWDAVDAPAFLVEFAAELELARERWPRLRFHALREHAGLAIDDPVAA